MGQLCSGSSTFLQKKQGRIDVKSDRRFLRFASLSTKRCSPIKSRRPITALLEGASWDRRSSFGRSLVGGSASEGRRNVNKYDANHTRSNSKPRDS